MVKATAMLIRAAALLLLAGTAAASAQVEVLRPLDPMPSFEVATIKPAEVGERFAAPLENTILSAFGPPGNLFGAAEIK